MFCEGCPISSRYSDNPELKNKVQILSLAHPIFVRQRKMKDVNTLEKGDQYESLIAGVISDFNSKRISSEDAYDTGLACAQRILNFECEVNIPDEDGRPKQMINIDLQKEFFED